MQSCSVYQTKQFARFARRARLTDDDLWQAAQRANDGLIDADLGGGVIKQRIARRGEGKSGGSRTIVLFRKADRAVFVNGYEKKDRANISSEELTAYRRLAQLVLGYSEKKLRDEVEAGALVRVESAEGGADAKEISQ